MATTKKPRRSRFDTDDGQQQCPHVGGFLACACQLLPSSLSSISLSPASHTKNNATTSDAATNGYMYSMIRTDNSPLKFIDALTIMRTRPRRYILPAANGRSASLPRDIIGMIFTFTNLNDSFACERVSRSWYMAAKHVGFGENTFNDHHWYGLAQLNQEIWDAHTHNRVVPRVSYTQQLWNHRMITLFDWLYPRVKVNNITRLILHSPEMSTVNYAPFVAAFASQLQVLYIDDRRADDNHFPWHRYSIGTDHDHRESSSSSPSLVAFPSLTSISLQSGTGSPIVAPLPDNIATIAPNIRSWLGIVPHNLQLLSSLVHLDVADDTNRMQLTSFALPLLETVRWAMMYAPYRPDEIRWCSTRLTRLSVEQVGARELDIILSISTQVVHLQMVMHTTQVKIDDAPHRWRLVLDQLYCPASLVHGLTLVRFPSSPSVHIVPTTSIAHLSSSSPSLSLSPLLPAVTAAAEVAAAIAESASSSSSSLRVLYQLRSWTWIIPQLQSFGCIHPNNADEMTTQEQQLLYEPLFTLLATSATSQLRSLSITCGHGLPPTMCDGFQPYHIDQPKRAYSYNKNGSSHDDGKEEDSDDSCFYGMIDVPSISLLSSLTSLTSLVYPNRIKLHGPNNSGDGRISTITILPRWQSLIDSLPLLSHH
jgi:hypothetical protein